ncbi:hypothetical protein K388_07300 [Streptomyces sp. KhCrAH-43]|uniref:hypothetical protein n=1 Tax=unclassified Streptomyces TaxID=2593676 RepID=UPI0003775B0A|nr:MULTISPECIES: hypothetical protein [unclassified Streptomyces]MYS36360.1 hypothetical protein [Streptomyces sp. SID4920]MYX64132.1 hypothetical protein [Streptomyces sp. SID8373]RAJ45727.1 hypothetical protein K388_07300 [Streptomyces sp. KhCrAH-43]
MNDLIEKWPYIAPWSEEPYAPDNLVWRESHLAYSDETPEDRSRGVLWLRHTSARGRGVARPAKIHLGRQREVMSTLSCQVCGKDTGREAAELWDGARLFLAGQNRLLADGELAATPPVHRNCAVRSLSEGSGCTHMRGTPVLALVKNPVQWGVHGLVHNSTQVPIGRRSIAYGDPALPYTLGLQAVVELHGCTPFTTEDLKAAA